MSLLDFEVRLVRAYIEPERWVLAGHERRVGDDTENPAVETEYKVEDVLRVAILEEHQDACDEDEDADKPLAPAGPGEDARDAELRMPSSHQPTSGRPRRRLSG